MKEWRKYNGQYAVLQVEKVKGLEPPPHKHTHEDEDFFILEGEVTYYIGDEVIHATPGTYVHAPRGVQHSFSMRSERAQVLVLLHPAGLEQLFKELSEPMPENYSPIIAPPPPEEIERQISTAAKYGIIFEVCGTLK